MQQGQPTSQQQPEWTRAASTLATQQAIPAQQFGQGHGAAGSMVPPDRQPGQGQPGPQLQSVPAQSIATQAGQREQPALAASPAGAQLPPSAQQQAPPSAQQPALQGQAVQASGPPIQTPPQTALQSGGSSAFGPGTVDAGSEFQRQPAAAQHASMAGASQSPSLGYQSTEQPGVQWEAQAVGQAGPGSQRSPEGAQQAGVPLVDVVDSPKSITVFVDLPGFEEDDIELQATDNSLHVAAARREAVDEDERPLQRERQERIERTIALPATIDVEEASAQFEDGVCEITLPKSEEDRGRSIAFQ